MATFDEIAEMCISEHKHMVAHQPYNPFAAAYYRKQKTGDSRLPSDIFKKQTDKVQKKKENKELREKLKRNKKKAKFDERQRRYEAKLAAEELAHELKRRKIEREREEKEIEELINEPGSAGLGHGEEHAVSTEAWLYAESCRTKPCIDSDIAGLALDPTHIFEQYRGDFGGLHTHCSLHFEEDPYTVTPLPEWK